jgi:hypothetical protein
MLLCQWLITGYVLGIYMPTLETLGGIEGLSLKEKLWAAVSLYTKYEFTEHMEELKRMDEKEFEFFSEVDPSTWSRAWFSDYPKSDLLVNNICECWNSYILKACNKPILTMLEIIRKKTDEKISSQEGRVREVDWEIMY